MFNQLLINAIIAGSIYTLIAIGFSLLLILQNVISMSFGDDTKTLRSGVVTEGIEYKKGCIKKGTGYFNFSSIAAERIS